MQVKILFANYASVCIYTLSPYILQAKMPERNFFYCFLLVPCQELKHKVGESKNKLETRTAEPTHLTKTAAAQL